MAITGRKYKLRQVIEAIGVELEMAQAGAAELVPTIVGDPGIGKSALLKKLAADKNLDCYIISLGAMPMEYFSGLPEFTPIEIKAEYHMEGKTEVNATEWTMADLVRSINVKAEQSLLPITDASGVETKPARDGLMVVLDDLHLVEPVIQNYLFEFFQNKTLQNYKLNSKAFLVAAMNGQASAGLQDFHSAVLNRMAFFFAEFDKEYWYENVGYALHPYIASFAQTSGSGDEFFSGANSVEGQSPSPRTWTDLSKTISFHERAASSLGDLNARLEMVSGSRVGDTASVAFMQHVKLFQQFNFRAILDAKDPEYTIGNDITDQILTAFIVRYIKNEDDAEYLYTLMMKNKDSRNFTGILVQEFMTMYGNMAKVDDEELKKALLHLSNLLTSDEAAESGFLAIVMDSIADLTI